MIGSLADRIYRAQCIGNVEPIEYMVPYPSTQSLLEGQNIKFSDQVIYKKDNITNLQFSLRWYGIMKKINGFGIEIKITI